MTSLQSCLCNTRQTMDPSRKYLWPVIFISVSTLLLLVPYIQGDPYYPACLAVAEASSIEGTPECIFRCPDAEKTVCGTDGYIYYNECFLCRKACVVPQIAKACDGYCPCKKDIKRDQPETNRDEHDEL
ncbi:uncharacterized protein [Amphiura filiformis]|uniref:uncharacterized protein n=1 Tax=Amphiura filiformis TaxID=82378 RepID=UPI003B2100F9